MFAHHEPSYCGHHGVVRTLERMRPYFWWPGIRKDVKRIVSSCYRCAASKQFPDKKLGRLKPILTEEPLEVVGVDLVGPFKESEQGNKYLLTCIDHYTRWAIAVPIPDVQASTVMNALAINWIEKIGIPRVILTDQGAQFSSELMQRMFDRYGMRHAMTAAYKPSTNGKVERMHRTLNNHLRTYANEFHTDWDVYVSPAMWAINTSWSTGLKCTPYEALFGRAPRTATDILYGEKVKFERDKALQLKNTDIWRTVHELVAAVQRQYAESMKKRYD